MLVFEDFLEICYSLWRAEVQCGALRVQRKADHFFCSLPAFSMCECVKQSTSTYNHPLDVLIYSFSSKS